MTPAWVAVGAQIVDRIFSSKQKCDIRSKGRGSRAEVRAGRWEKEGTDKEVERGKVERGFEPLLLPINRPINHAPNEAWDSRQG